MFTVQKEKNDTWIKNSSGDIVTGQNIDSYLRTIDNTEANNLLKSLQDIHNQVNAGTMSWDDYFKTCKDGKAYLIDFVQNTNLQTASTKDLIKANQSAREAAIAHNEELKNLTFGAKTATVATKALAIAGNMIAMWAVSKIISIVVGKINDLAHAAQNVSEAFDELTSESQAHLEKLQNESDTMKDLISQYEELASAETYDSSTRSDIKDIQEQITELVGTQASNLDLVNGKLDEELEKLHEIASEEATETLEQAVANYTNTVNSANAALANKTIGIGGINNVVVKEESDDAAALYELLSQKYDGGQVQRLTNFWGTETSGLIIEDDMFDGAAEKIAYLEEMAEYIKENYSNYSSSTVYSAIKSQISSYQKYLDAIETATQDLLNAGVTDSYYNNEELNNITVDSVETFQEYRDKLIEILSNSDDFKAAFTDGAISVEDIQSAVDSYLATLTEFEDYYKKINSKFDGTTDNSFTDILTQVQSLSKGLDQLGEIYVDVYDKEDFDWSSILNNDDFKNTFGKMGDTYDNFIKTVSNSPDDINACQQAFNNLATAYIYNSGALDNLTEDTKYATVAMLEQMGVTNAEAVVNNALNGATAELYKAKEQLGITTSNLSDLTISEIEQLLNEGNISEFAKNKLYELYLTQIDLNGNPIDALNSINQLLSMVDASSAAGIALTELGEIMSKISQTQNFLETASDDTSLVEATLQGLKNKAALIKEKALAEFKNSNTVEYAPASYTGDSTTPSTKTGSGSSSTPSDTSQTFDWIETKLDLLSKKTSSLSEAFSNAYSIDDKNNAYLNYLSAIQEEIDANNTAIAYYQQKLNEIGLSYEWISKIQSGAFDISTITDQSLIDQIQQYQSIYEKIQGYQDSIQSLEQQRQKAQADHAQDVVDTYEKEIEAFQKIIDKRKALIALKETFGSSASAKDLKTEQDAVNRQINRLEEQNRGLDQLIRTTTYGSEAWQIYRDKIDDNKNSVLDLTQSLADLAKELANLPMDKLDAYLEKNSKKNELLDAKLDNATTSKKQNSIVNQQMKLLKKDNQKTQKTAEKTQENLSDSISNFSSAKKTDKKYATSEQKTKIDEYYKQIKSYTKSKKQIPSSLITKLTEEGHSNLAQAAVNYNAALEANETAQATAALTAETTKTQLAELAKTKFDNTQTEYERKQGQISNKANTINAAMELSTAKGYLDSQKWYEQLIAYEQQNQASLQAEANALQERLDKAMAAGNIEKYSDEWWEMTEAIQSVNEALAEGKITLQEYINKLDEIKFSNFDYIQQQISRLTSESDFLIDLMSNQDLTDDNGLTDFGMATLGLHYQNYDTYMKQAEKYGEEIQKINAMLANDPNNTKLIEQQQQYEDAQRDCILAAEKEKNAVIELKKQGYDALATSLKDVAAKYKESLRSAKDAHDYQKNIAEQSENINSLQKKITAYSSMSGNEEIASKLQQANKELAEAQESLEETMYDKYISDTENILDDMVSDLEEFVNELYSNLSEEFEADRQTITENAGKINETLNSVASQYGLKTSEALQAIWKNGYTPETGFTSIVDKIETLIAASNAQADQTADALVYEDVKDSYHQNISDYENKVANAQSQLESAKANKQSIKDSYQAAKSERDELKAERDTMAKKYAKDSKQYKSANEKYLAAKDKASALKDSLNEANLTVSNSQASYDAAVKERDDILSSNKAVVQDFLNRIVNTEPTKTEENMTALDRIINQLTGGYITDYNVQQLADLLGTGTDTAEILAMLEKLGFPSIPNFTPVSDMKYSEAPQTAVSETNGLLSPKNIPVISTRADNFPAMSQLFHVSLPTYDDKFTASTTASSHQATNIDLGGITMYGVNDPETFGRQLREEICKNGRTTKCISEAVASKITNNGIGTANMYR